MDTISKREFLRITAAGLACCAIPTGASGADSDSVKVSGAPLHEAMFYRKLTGGLVRCELCPHRCVISVSSRGKCGVRENRVGTLYSMVHSKACALNNDPIEKKPLFHFRPGTNAFSLATAGCNLECRFCQNWEISQFRPEQIPYQDMPPEKVLLSASDARSSSIAFTYSEPTIFYEYARDICMAASGTGIGRVMISNGYIQKTPMEKLLPHLDAVKIDFKSFGENFYRDICSAQLAPVLSTLQTIKDAGVWLELVMLVIPTLNDSEREFDAMSRWVVQKLGPDVPIHFTRFHPMYKLLNLPPTPVSTLEKARITAMQNGVHYAYAGNIPGHPSENTSCPWCNNTLIRRNGYRIMYNHISSGRCNQCGKPIAGRWT